MCLWWIWKSLDLCHSPALSLVTSRGCFSVGSLTRKVGLHSKFRGWRSYMNLIDVVLTQVVRWVPYKDPVKRIFARKPSPNTHQSHVEGLQMNGQTGEPCNKPSISTLHEYQCLFTEALMQALLLIYGAAYLFILRSVLFLFELFYTAAPPNYQTLVL